MSNTVLYMSMSVDGFIAGPNDGPGNALGDGGHRLHEWIMPDADAGHEEIRDHVGRLPGANREVMDEVQIHLVPVLLGQGRPLFEDMLFEDMSPRRAELELLRAAEGPGVLHLRYRVRPGARDAATGRGER